MNQLRNSSLTPSHPLQLTNENTLSQNQSNSGLGEGLFIALSDAIGQESCDVVRDGTGQFVHPACHEVGEVAFERLPV